MRGVHRDFGKEYDFQEPYVPFHSILDMLVTGEAKEYPSDQWDYKLVVYTGGTFPKVVYQRRRIPTFDSSDRRYDSWHDLYLAKYQDGVVWAVYATGGYEISSVEGWKNVVSCPQHIRELLEA